MMLVAIFINSWGKTDQDESQNKEETIIEVTDS